MQGSGQGHLRKDDQFHILLCRLVAGDLDLSDVGLNLRGHAYDLGHRCGESIHLPCLHLSAGSLTQVLLSLISCPPQRHESLRGNEITGLNVHKCGQKTIPKR